MMEQKISFGFWMRLRRKALDLTQAGLGQLVGCSAAAIRKFEADERRPSAHMLTRLAEIFDIPPEQQPAFLRFGRGDWASPPVEAIRDEPWRTSTRSPRSNLPAASTSLIGRTEEVKQVCGYLANVDIRLVTLIGPLGIGKTRLSLEVGRASLSKFPDGVFFVALALLDDASLVAPAILQSLGYVESKILRASEQLSDGIGDKRMLLVLDNCEHLIEGIAQLVSELLVACSGLKILITSREALRIRGEWIYSVPILKVPKDILAVNMDTVSRYPAVTLFAERARAVRSDFALSPENLQAVSSICTQLDGLPLAIELIAARIRLMSPQALLARLSDPFVLSADGMRSVSARQKTLHNAIRWSYDLLSSDEQKLFAYLSVFSGGFSLEASEGIFGRWFVEKSVSDLVTSLVDKSLLQHTIPPQSEPRFHMLVTIQKFALARLRQVGEEARARNWHLAYYLELAEKADQEIHGPDQVDWINHVESEHDNLRAAIDWCISTQKAETGLRLLGALGWPWEVRSHYSEMRSQYEKIQSLPEVTHHPAIHARLLDHIGRHCWTQGDFEEARAFLEQSRGIWLQLGEEGEQGLAENLNWSGLLALWANRDYNAAEVYLHQSLELFQKWGNPRMALSIFHLGILEVDRNQYAKALSLLEQSLAMFSELGDLFSIARVSVFLGILFAKQGNYQKALYFIEQHLKMDQRLLFWDGIADGLHEMGDIYHNQGDIDQAEQFYEHSLTVCREHGLFLGITLYSLGLVALQRKDYSLALQRFTDYYPSARKANEKTSAAVLLTGLAAVAGGTGQPERCAELYGAAEAIIGASQDPISPFDRVEFERHIQIGRDQIGEQAFTALQSSGGTMTQAQAIARALNSPISLETQR